MKNSTTAQSETNEQRKMNSKEKQRTNGDDGEKERTYASYKQKQKKSEEMNRRALNERSRVQPTRDEL